MPNYTNSLSALNAFDTVMQASANNIANINTYNYKAYRVGLETGPHDQGVRVGSISRDIAFGPAVITENSLREKLTAENHTQQSLTDMANADSITVRQEAAKNRYSDDFVVDGIVRGNGYTEGSNTDLSREFVTMMATENAYGANAAVIRTVDDMSGAILNMLI